jgi:hypothetical protein
MLGRIARHLTYANVMVTLLALLVLGGGSAVASSHLLDGRSLENGSVTRPKLARNVIASPQVQNGTIGVADLSAAARAALQGQAGPAGAPGAPGAPGVKGDTGIQGPPGAAGAGVRMAWAYDFVGGAGGAGSYDISLTNADRSSGLLVVDVASTLFVDASTSANNAHATDGSTLVCSLQVEAVGVGGGATGGEVLRFQYLPPTGEADQNIGWYEAIAVADTFEVEPGSYDVGMTCGYHLGGTSGFSTTDSELRVMAFPA